MHNTRALAPVLTGRVAEYQTIFAAIDQATGLTVLSCVPCSGTSALLAAAVQETRQTCLLVDARRCRDTLDLAMAIADAAVRTLAPEATSWWFDANTPFTTEALRVHRAVSQDGIDLDDLRSGGGNALDRLNDALRLTCALAEAYVTVIVDHLGPLLWQEGAARARALLGQLRTSFQGLRDLGLVLADFTDGPAVAAVADQAHPLYRAGDVITVARPNAQRFVDDLAITRPSPDVSAPLLRACADLTAGAPAMTWRAISLADRSSGAPEAAMALAGWRELRYLTEPTVSHQWDALRRVHPLAQTVTAVVATGLRPHGTIAANDKSISDATRVMRALGIAWQPEHRRWAIADPLLAAYARDHAPPWVGRRHATADRTPEASTTHR